MFSILNPPPSSLPIPLALFVVMLFNAHLTSHSRLSGCRSVITPSWLSGSWRSFLYSSSVYSCHLFLISNLTDLKFSSSKRWNTNYMYIEIGYVIDNQQSETYKTWFPESALNTCDLHKVSLDDPHPKLCIFKINLRQNNRSDRIAKNSQVPHWLLNVWGR